MGRMAWVQNGCEIYWMPSDRYVIVRGGKVIKNVACFLDALTFVEQQ